MTPRRSPGSRARSILPLIVFALAALPGGCGGSEARLKEARALLASGRADKAADRLAGVAARSPGDAPLLVEYARALHAAGREADSLKAVETALRAAPDDLEARTLHGVVLGALGRYDEGLAELRQVAQREPGRPGVHRAMAVIQARAGRYGPAVNQFEKELARNPSDVDTLTDLGVFYLQTGQIEQAEDRLRRAAGAPDATARAHRYYAEALFKEKRREEGLAEQAAALRITPDDSDLLISHARALEGYGHSGEGRAAIQKAIDRGLSDARLWAELGRLAREALDYDGSADRYRKATEVDPGFAEGFMELGKVRLLQGRRDDARAAFTDAMRLAPTDAYAPYYLATMLSDDGRPGDAIPLLRRSLDLDPLNPKAHYALAQALQRSGHADEAQAEFARHADILRKLREKGQTGGTASME